MQQDDQQEKKFVAEAEALPQQESIQQSQTTSALRDEYLKFFRSKLPRNNITNISKDQSEDLAQPQVLFRQKKLNKLFQTLKSHLITLDLSYQSSNDISFSQFQYCPQLNGELFGLAPIKQEKILSDLPPFQIIKIESISQQQAFKLNIRFMHFTIDLLILENLQNSTELYKSVKKNQSGSYGQIYYFKRAFSLFQSNYVIKSIHFTSDKLFHILIRTLKQVVISKIASALQFGPAFLTIFGFDLIIYQDSIEFCLQNCQIVNGARNLDSFIIENDLVDALRLMHFFKIVHLDIKPENIAYSQKFKKWIFIDFGLSQIIIEKIGEKSLTNFNGTYSYASEDMKKCFFEDNYVDLYYNDVFGLQRTIESLRVCSKKSTSRSVYSQSQHGQDRNKKIRTNYHEHPRELEYILFHSIVINDCERLKSHWQSAQYIFFEKHLKNRNFQNRSKKELQHLIDLFEKSDSFKKVIRFLLNIQDIIIVQEIYSQFLNTSIQNFKILQLIQDKIFSRFVIVNPSDENLFYSSPRCNSKTPLPKLFDLLKNLSSNNQNYRQKFILTLNQTEIRKILMDSNSFIEMEINQEHYFELFYNFVTFRKNLFNASLAQKIKTAQIFKRNFNIKDTFLNKDKDFKQIFIKQCDSIKHNSQKFTQDCIRKVFSLCFDVLLSYCSQGPITNFKKKYFLQIVEEMIFINVKFFTPNIAEEVSVCQERLNSFVENVLKSVDFLSNGNQTESCLGLLRVQRILRMLEFQKYHCVLYSKRKLYDKLRQKEEKADADIYEIVEKIMFFSECALKTSELNFQKTYCFYEEAINKIQEISIKRIRLKEKRYLLQSLSIEYFKNINKLAIDMKLDVRWYNNKDLQSKLHSKNVKNLYLNKLKQRDYIDSNNVIFTNQLNNLKDRRQIQRNLNFIDRVINYSQISSSILPVVRCSINVQFKIIPQSFKIYRRLLSNFNPFNLLNISFLINLVKNWIMIIKVHVNRQYNYPLPLQDLQRLKQMKQKVCLVEGQLVSKIIISLFGLYTKFKQFQSNQTTLNRYNLEFCEKFYQLLSIYRFHFIVEKGQIKSNYEVTTISEDNLQYNNYIKWEQAALNAVQKYTQNTDLNIILFDPLLIHLYPQVCTQLQKTPKYNYLSIEKLRNIKHMQYNYQINCKPYKVIINRLQQFQNSFYSYTLFYFLLIHDFLIFLRKQIFFNPSFLSHGKLSNSNLTTKTIKFQGSQYDEIEFCFFKIAFTAHIKQPYQTYSLQEIHQETTQRQNIIESTGKHVSTNSQDKINQKNEIMKYIVRYREGILHFCEICRQFDFDLYFFGRFQRFTLVYIMLVYYNNLMKSEQPASPNVDQFIYNFIKKASLHLGKINNLATIERFLHQYVFDFNRFLNILFIQDEFTNQNIDQSVILPIVYFRPDSYEHKFVNMDKVLFIFTFFQHYKRCGRSFCNRYEQFMFFRIIHLFFLDSDLIQIITSDVFQLKDLIRKKNEKFKLTQFPQLDGKYPLRKQIEKTIKSLIVDLNDSECKIIQKHKYSTQFLAKLKEDIVYTFLKLVISIPKQHRYDKRKNLPKQKLVDVSTMSTRRIVWFIFKYVSIDAEKISFTSTNIYQFGQLKGLLFIQIQNRIKQKLNLSLVKSWSKISESKIQKYQKSIIQKYERLKFVVNE